MNKKNIYRYRSFNTAIAELESGTLRCVIIEKNNDPADGYFELNFNGDKVLWNNFFKNYIKALCLYASEIIISGDDPIFASKVEVRVNSQFFLDVKDAPFNQQIEIIFKEFYKTELYEKTMLYLIDKDISEDNIIMISFFLHKFIFDILCDTFNKTGLGEFLQILKMDIKLKTELPINYNRYIDALTRSDKKEIDIISYISKNQYKTFLAKRNILLTQPQGYYKKNIFDINALFPLLYLEELKKLLFPNIYVTCFTSNPGNMCMWAHYAENHQGVCFEYKIDFEKNFLKEVKYNKKPNTINFFEHLGRYNRADLCSNWLTFNEESSSIKEAYLGENFRKKHWELIEDLALSKGENWSYECEYRIWKDDFCAQDGAEFIEIPKFNSDKLTGVIFGKNITLENKNIMIEKLREKINLGELGEIKLYETVNKFETYDYEIIEYGIIKKE